VIDAVTLRPLQETNTLKISTVTASKSAMIRCQLLIRDIIQAIAYS
jgi:hypothetical protein